MGELDVKKSKKEIMKREKKSSGKGMKEAGKGAGKVIYLIVSK